MIRRCFTNKSAGVITPLYKTLVRPIIENCSPAWDPWLQKDIAQLDKVQQRCINMANNPLLLEPLTLRRQKADLVETYKQINGMYKCPSLLHTKEVRTRGHSARLPKAHTRTEVRQHFFTNRVVNKWNKLPESTVTAPSIQSFKDRLELTT